MNAPTVTARQFYAAAAEQNVPCMSDPDLFFPDGEGRMFTGQIAAAKAQCGTCPIKDMCREFAITTRQSHGIWGGMSEEELAEAKRVRDGKQSHAARNLDRALAQDGTLPLGEKVPA